MEHFSDPPAQSVCEDLSLSLSLSLSSLPLVTAWLLSMVGKAQRLDGSCMKSCTLFLWMRVPSIVEKYKTAVLISGLLAFIAEYHYNRIFNSWVDSYYYPLDGQS